MNAAIKLLDKFVQVCRYESDSAAARALKVRPSAVNNWRQQRAMPDAESVEKMCIATGENPAHWLPLIEAERARSPGAKRAWLRIAQSAAAVAFIVSIGRLDVHHVYNAGALFVAHSPSTLSIM